MDCPGASSTSLTLPLPWVEISQVLRIIVLSPSTAAVWRKSEVTMTLPLGYRHPSPDRQQPSPDTWVMPGGKDPYFMPVALDGGAVPYRRLIVSASDHRFLRNTCTPSALTCTWLEHQCILRSTHALQLIDTVQFDTSPVSFSRPAQHAAGYSDNTSMVWPFLTLADTCSETIPPPLSVWVSRQLSVLLSPSLSIMSIFHNKNKALFYFHHRWHATQIAVILAVSSTSWSCTCVVCTISLLPGCRFLTGTFLDPLI